MDVMLVVSQKSLEGPLSGPVGFVLAFFIGTISFFSPCVLPLVPGYLSFVSGLSGEEADARAGRRRVLAGTTLFVLGFSTMFTAIGALGSFVGVFLREHLEVITKVAGVLVIVMGLAFALPRLFPFLERERRPFLHRARPGLAGAYPLGLAFGAGWTACIGPGLGVMLGLSADSGSVAKGALLVFFFSLGFGFWFILAGLGFRKVFGASSFLRRRMGALQLVGGMFMVAIGVLLVTGQWDSLIAPLRRWAGNFAPPV